MGRAGPNPSDLGKARHAPWIFTDQQGKARLGWIFTGRHGKARLKQGWAVEACLHLYLSQFSKKGVVICNLPSKIKPITIPHFYPFLILSFFCLPLYPSLSLFSHTSMSYAFFLTATVDEIPTSISLSLLVGSLFLSLNLGEILSSLLIGFSFEIYCRI